MLIQALAQKVVIPLILAGFVMVSGALIPHPNSEINSLIEDYKKFHSEYIQWFFNDEYVQEQTNGVWPGVDTIESYAAGEDFEDLELTNKAFEIMVNEIAKNPEVLKGTRIEIVSE